MCVFFRYADVKINSEIDVLILEMTPYSYIPDPTLHGLFSYDRDVMVAAVSLQLGYRLELMLIYFVTSRFLWIQSPFVFSVELWRIQIPLSSLASHSCTWSASPPERNSSLTDTAS